LISWVSSQSFIGTAASEQPSWVILNYLELHPSFSERNVGVGEKMLELIKSLAQQTSACFNGACCSYAISNFVFNKLGEFGSGDKAVPVLTAMAEAVGFPYVLGKLFNSLGDTRIAKHTTKFLEWFCESLPAFGTNSLPIEALIAELVKLLSNPVPSVQKKLIGAFIAVANAYKNPSAVLTLISTLGKDSLKQEMYEKIRLALEKNCGQATSPMPSSIPPVVSSPVSMPPPTQPLSPQAVLVSSGPVIFPTRIPRKVIDDLQSLIWETRRDAVSEMNRILHQDCNMRISPDLGQLEQHLIKF